MKNAGIFVSIALLFASELWISPVEAANRYGVVCIRNDTTRSIRYSVKIGEGSWNWETSVPGRQTTFSHQYDSINENRSPSFRVRFDSDLRGQFITRYKLSRGTAPSKECKEGNIYTFRFERDHNYIDLVPTNGGTKTSE